MGRSLAYEPRNALNAICPYFTMFPLEYPLRVMDKHRQAQPVVMDPFCGRGTTLFAARSLGLTARGIDSSPVAVAIARAKLCKVESNEALYLADEFIKTYKSVYTPDSEFFQRAFDGLTLRQICAIRKGLLDLPRDSNAAVLLRATMLGCLHGPKNKGTLSYFSNQMPRTFAPKPDYAVRYWRERRMRAPKVEVLNVLAKKLARLQEPVFSDGMAFNNVRIGDSRFTSALPERLRDYSLVVTSPPYYGMRTYLEDQWLRNWFLGGPSKINYGNKEQLEHDGHESFARSLGAVWKNMARTNSDSLHMYIRFGTIPSAHTDPRVLLRNSLKISGENWRVISTREAATASSGKRQANLMAAGSAPTLEYDFHVELQ